MLVKCIKWHEYLTYGQDYEVIDRMGNSFKVIDNLGNYNWFGMEYFQW